MKLYYYYIIDINEEATFSFVNKEKKEIYLMAQPSRGSLICIENDFYSVVDLIQQDNASPIITIIKVNDDIPTIYKEIKL